jgi:NAD(P)-dependent dehydrogenase (short-subunit alcohol dehydrogenase family)
VEQAVDRFVGMDRLIHCARIMPGGRVRDMDVAPVARVMEVNYVGTVRVVEAGLPGMRARGGGQMVVLGSLTGYVPPPGFGAYSASKAAVNAYVESLAHEERRSGVQDGGPGFIGRLDEKSSSSLMITSDAVLGLARSDDVWRTRCGGSRRRWRRGWRID